MQLAHQVSEAASSHKRELKEHTNEDVSSDEFLSGFWKTDKLLPVVTLVIYWGAKEWDAPLSLREMYSCQEPAILEHAADYHVNLIAPNMLADDDIDRFRSNLREVLLYIKYSNDKEKLSNIVNNDDNFKKVEKQAADVINIMTGSKLKYPEGKEINMCLAIEQMRNESELLGEIKGAVRMCRKFGASYEKTVQQIIEDFDISEDEAEMYVKKYWE